MASSKQGTCDLESKPRGRWKAGRWRDQRLCGGWTIEVSSTIGSEDVATATVVEEKIEGSGRVGSTLCIGLISGGRTGMVTVLGVFHSGDVVFLFPWR